MLFRVAGVLIASALLQPAAPDWSSLPLDTYPAAARTQIGAARDAATEQPASAEAAGQLALVLHAWEQFDAAAKHVTAADVREKVLVSSDLGRQLAWLQEYVELGVDSLYLHHVGQTQDAFIDAFAEKVLPELQADDGGSDR